MDTEPRCSSAATMGSCGWLMMAIFKDTPVWIVSGGLQSDLRGTGMGSTG